MVKRFSRAYTYNKTLMRFHLSANHGFRNLNYPPKQPKMTSLFDTSPGIEIRQAFHCLSIKHKSERQLLLILVELHIFKSGDTDRHQNYDMHITQIHCLLDNVPRAVPVLLHIIR
jgi:hypothetical protein